ncbi:hypothetical protein ACP26L_36450 (plasmid) [Paenibacillus sp. S-38]|uniref:hypothetical protein n=1 Tax=Paenibacillus sp. S-38 TaxID=3416710 RepID=UPI003CF313B0
MKLLKTLSIAVIAFGCLAASASAADKNIDPGVVNRLPSKPANEKVYIDLQVAKKLDEINSKYKVGEAFSEEDAAYVKAHALKVPERKAGAGFEAEAEASVQTDHYWYDGSRYVNGTGYYSQGYVTSDLGWIQHTVTTNLAGWVSDNKYVPKITNEVKYTAYGAVGTSGIGLIADLTLTNDCLNANYCHQQKAQGWSGVPVYYAIFPKSVFNTADVGAVDVLPTRTREW